MSKTAGVNGRKTRCSGDLEDKTEPKLTEVAATTTAPATNVTYDDHY